MNEPLASWAHVELLGHRSIFGFVTEVELGGGKVLKIDTPAVAAEIVTGVLPGWDLPPAIADALGDGFSSSGRYECDVELAAVEGQTHYASAASLYCLRCCTQEQVLTHVNRDRTRRVIAARPRLTALEGPATTVSESQLDEDEDEDEDDDGAF